MHCVWATNRTHTTWALKGTRSRGRPRETWRRTVEAERQRWVLLLGVRLLLLRVTKQFVEGKSTVLFSQRRAKTYDEESLKYVCQDAQFKKLKNITGFPHF